jgi:hypothetical protein
LKKITFITSPAQNSASGQLPGRFKGDPEMKILMTSIVDLNNG